MEKERSNLKKIFLILLGISIILVGVIFIIYKNNQSINEDVVDIFKEETIEEKEEPKKEIKKIIVDIKGMVANPGVYEVEEGKRVNDIILLAGGLLDNADTSLINLAKIVEDEMTIIIYSNKEVIEKYKEEVCVCDCPLINNSACIENNDKEENKIININTGDYNELMKIPGIGESKAKSIIKYREEYGNFNTIEDIKKVSGIGDSLFEDIKEYITV